MAFGVPVKVNTAVVLEHTGVAAKVAEAVGSTMVKVMV